MSGLSPESLKQAMAEADGMAAERARDRDVVTRSWKWVVNPKSHSVALSEGSHGNLVMCFRRWGMGGATPHFNVDGLMVPAHQLSTPELGREHHADWWRVIDHPAARLIEAAPVLLAAAHRALVNHEDAGCSCEGCARLRAAILFAEGRR